MELMTLTQKWVSYKLQIIVKVYTANSIKVELQSQNIITSTSKRVKHDGYAYTIMQLIVRKLCSLYMVATFHMCLTPLEFGD